MNFFDYSARVIQVFRVACRQAARYLFRRVSGRPAEGPLLLREAFETLSGSFLKFGQILALQTESLPLEYCDALLSLLDRVPQISWEDVEQVFAEELDASPRTLFEAFESRAVAAASIGQVHRATTKNGASVAVKVQRPGIRRVFERDLVLLQAFVRLILLFRLRRLYFMRDPVRELSAWTRDELDYRIEAGYCQLLGENAAHTPTERIPAVHWDLTTRRILTLDFLEGPSVADYLRMQQEGDEARLAELRERGFVAAEFSSNIISNFLSDAFRFGVFHADLHPANLIILPGNVVGYVDFGIVAILTREARRKQLELTMAYASGSADSIYRQFLNICTMGPESDISGLRAELSVLSRGWYQEPPIAGRVRFRVSITHTMMDMLSVCQRYGVLVDREMIKYIRSTILADGLISRLAPGFDLAAILRSVVEKYAVEEGRKRIFSTAGALSILSDLAVWLEAGPRDFVHALSMLERRELRIRTNLARTPDKYRATRVRTVYVAVIWALLVLFLTLGGGLPSFRTSPLLAVLASLFVTLWSLWLTRLLFRLRTRGGGRSKVQELINSVARFSAAMTLFGIQEIQNAVGAAVESPEYLNRFRRSLDSISNAIASELDPASRPTLESVTNLSNEMVGRTIETLKTPGLDPRQMLQSASDMIRKTADSLTRPVAASQDAPPRAGEPQPAEDVLAAK